MLHMHEYGRGAIPTILPFGLSDAVFRCMDATTIVKTIVPYSKMVIKELLQGKI